MLNSMGETTPFDINAVVSGAIKRRFNNYKNLLSTSLEDADELKTEHAAILKNVTESLSYSHLQAEGIQFFLDVFPTFERWGYWADCIDTSETILEFTLPPERQVRLYANLGRMHLLNRNLDDSLHYLNLGLDIAQKNRLENDFGLLHHRLMNTYIEREEYDLAQENGLKALTYLSDSPSITLAAVYDSLGRAFTGLNNLTKAENYFWKALSHWDSLKDYTHMARSYRNLGSLYFWQDNLDDAKKCFEASLEALSNLSNIWDELGAINGLGIVYHSAKDYDKAIHIFQKAAHKLDHELGDKAGWYSLRGSLMHNLGNTLLAKGDSQQALVALNRAKTFWQQANDNLQLANTIGTIAEAYQADKEWETAVATYNKAINLLADYPSHPWATKLTNDFTYAKKTCAEQLNSPKE